MGPLTLDKLGSPLPVEMVDFGAGAEVVEGTYRGAGGEGTLMLISYPTPQIATDHFHRIEQAHQPNAQAGQPAVVEMGAFAQKRSGPLVAVATGTFTQNEAENLVKQVHYDADVTWNENTFFDKKNNVANLLWNAVLLCGALMGITLVAGVAFGGCASGLEALAPATKPESGTGFHLSEHRRIGAGVARRNGRFVESPIRAGWLCTQHSK